MKQERKEELIVRWMDNELPASEAEELNAILENEPELKELRSFHSELKVDLSSVFEQPKDIPYGDFFETKLAQAIREGESQEEVQQPKSSGWRDALRWWLAPVAIAAMAVAFLAGTRVNSGPEATRTVIASVGPVVYTPEGGVTANFVDAEGSGTSVIVLDGLPPIPDSFDLMANVQYLDDHDGENFQLVTAKKERSIY